MEKMVWATAVETSDTSKSPRKLNTAAMMMACRGFMARVETAVAMALGASVAPFTMITPILSRVTTRRMGFRISSERKKAHSIDHGSTFQQISCTQKMRSSPSLPYDTPSAKTDCQLF